ncbi:MmgE/PrpD family protein [Arthrobacter bambusae]|uniref:MmgE/PrpD family protein n=1 Tax=Arthrobacter bambusae TaxID=1338426 RepID=UPI001F51239A|nr:MmgE/PrpD family protein [Arthrobacter bambusae]MCI0142594.1 MmgE/PrpD family protein [Arthrobacter bambusae]
MQQAIAIEQQLARHAATLTWEQLPLGARRQAIRATLWWTATALEGSLDAQQEQLRAYALRTSASPEATILGGRSRVLAEFAGLVNGRAGKAMEREDKYMVDEAIGFAIGCAVVPAAVALSQARLNGPVSGTDLLTAVSLGVDVEARLVRAVGLGFMPGRTAANATFAMGTYGAATAAGKILGLNELQMLDAWGLAHGQAAGNFQGQVEGRGVAVQCGFAVRNGVVAAKLAAVGIEGPHNFISGRAGLYEVHFPASQPELSTIIERLGSYHPIVDLAFKRYPCGIVAHPAVGGVIALRNQMRRPGDIAAIKVVGPRSLSIMAEPLPAKQSPGSPVEAQFSIPWAVACAARDGDLMVDHYSVDAIGDPALRQLATCVDVELRDVEATVVSLTTHDGTTIVGEPVRWAEGHPSKPLSTHIMEQLFLSAAHRAMIPEGQAQEALDRLKALDAETDIDEVFSLLGGPLGS